MTDEMAWLLLRQVGGLLVCFLVLMPAFTYLVLKPAVEARHRFHLKDRFIRAGFGSVISPERLDLLADNHARRKWENQWINPL